MPYKKRILPSAREEFIWYCETYGAEVQADARRWVDALARAAETGIRKLLYVSSLDDLRIQNSPEAKHGQWWYSLKRLREAEFAEKVDAAITFLRSQYPPWESYWAFREFDCLGGLSVEMLAAFQINHSAHTILFTRFL